MLPLRISALAISALAVLAADPSRAQSTEGVFGQESASVTYGPYARVELGYANADSSEGYWLPPGYPRDPVISFNVDLDDGGYGALAFGYDWQNGFRGEFAAFGLADADLTAPCSGASNGTPCSTHADISQASVKTRGAMLNLYYAPLEAMGRNQRLQPFLVAGVGSAKNTMSAWTRTNPASGRPTRTFQGGTNTDVAWSLGAGVAYELDRGAKTPIMFEATYRYFDLGKAVGGSAPLPGNGSSQPVAPFQFDNASHVVGFGLRIPLQRY
jgi:opacity protein-like surface antigen